MTKFLILLGVCFAMTQIGFAQAPTILDNLEYERAKADGRLQSPQQTPIQPNYPVPANLQRLKSGQTFSKRTNDQSKKTNSLSNASASFSIAPPLSGCTIENPAGDLSFQNIPRNDDSYSSAIKLPFAFSLYGDTYDTVFVNNNGNVSFGMANAAFSSTGFPSQFRMVAPFWADVDTRHPNSGLVYYKVESTKLTVIWDSVGYFNTQADKLNTFKLVITNGADPTIGVGNNVAFYYGDMQWTTGSASSGSNGFGGIPATVGANKGSGNNACFFYQMGRFSLAGGDSTNLQTTGAGIDYLDNKCFFFDVSTVQGLALDFTHRKYVCATTFAPALVNTQNCRVNSYQWTFGDGGSSAEFNPVHAYAQPGTYTVSLTVKYNCGACSEATVTKSKSITISPNDDLLKDTLLTVATQEQVHVLQTAASTFSDVWPLPYENKDLDARNSYLNGTKGVWRNEGVYAYQVDRQVSAPVKTATDGTFTAERFNWPQAEVNAIPHWIKAESKTLYSPHSYELENRDVLGVYSAALYDYGGHLPTANGMNTRHSEMAFTSFEYLDGNATGNWVFGIKPLPQYSTYTVNIATRHAVVLEARLSDLENVTKVDIQARAWGLFTWGTNYLQEVEVVCKQAHPTNPAWSMLVLKQPPFNGLWFGNLRVRNQVDPLINPEVDTTYAHAGQSSLRITSPKTFKQPLVQLETGKSYFVSAWVSVGNAQLLTPKLADNLGLLLNFKDKQGTTLSSTSFAPAGPVIEGWQQVRGVVICPNKDARLEVTFQPGSTGTAWYDDLRLHPEKSNMKSYVYQLDDYRLRAILDEENFASFFYYDAEGNLYLTKKETEEGIKTLTENVSYLKKNGN